MWSGSVNVVSRPCPAFTGIEWNSLRIGISVTVSHQYGCAVEYVRVRVCGEGN